MKTLVDQGVIEDFLIEGMGANQEPGMHLPHPQGK